MQTHLGSHASERPGDKVRGADPCLERPKWMLYCLPAHTHRFWMRVETRLHRIEHLFMLPAFNATLYALGGLRLDRATRTRRAPISIECTTVLDVPLTPDQGFAGPERRWGSRFLRRMTINKANCSILAVALG